MINSAFYYAILIRRLQTYAHTILMRAEYFFLFFFPQCVTFIDLYTLAQCIWKMGLKVWTRKKWTTVVWWYKAEKRKWNEHHRIVNKWWVVLTAAHRYFSSISGSLILVSAFDTWNIRSTSRHIHYSIIAIMGSVQRWKRQTKLE